MWVCTDGGYRCCCGNGGCAVVAVVDDDGEELIYYFKNKVSLQTNLEKNSSNFSYIYFLGVNFENLTIEFHVSYVLNMHIKFRSNRILFII